jgi:hypothetical protein
MSGASLGTVTQGPQIHTKSYCTPLRVLLLTPDIHASILELYGKLMSFIAAMSKELSYQNLTEEDVC